VVGTGPKLCQMGRGGGGGTLVSTVFEGRILHENKT
jgi:hypothetical protein